MSILSLDEMSLTDEEEKSILWLDTYYYDSVPYNIANMNTTNIWISEAVRPKYVDILLAFEFKRISELEFQVNCIHTPLPYSEANNYKLRFYCTINVLGQKIFQMPNSQHSMCMSYWLSNSYRQNTDIYKLFQLKIIVKMVEYDCSLTNMYLYHESELQNMKEELELFYDELVIVNLCFILEVPTLTNIFTGCQNNEYAMIKRNYIRRTAYFALQIAEFLQRRECIELTIMDQALNYILNNERKSISHEDLIKVYLEGQRMGLKFLLVISRDLMIKRICNLSTAVDALLVADRVKDNKLFSQAEYLIYYWWIKNDFHTEWLNELNNSNIQCRFMVDSLKYHFTPPEINYVETGPFSSIKKYGRPLCFPSEFGGKAYVFLTND